MLRGVGSTFAGGRLGAWLEHYRAGFGIGSSSPGSAPLGYASADGVMRTGFTEAWLTDAKDDSYDLSWFNKLPEADRPAIAKLRELLASNPDQHAARQQRCNGDSVWTAYGRRSRPLCGELPGADLPTRAPVNQRDHRARPSARIDPDS